MFYAKKNKPFTIYEMQISRVSSIHGHGKTVFSLGRCLVNMLFSSCKTFNDLNNPFVYLYMHISSILYIDF